MKNHITRDIIVVEYNEHLQEEWDYFVEKTSINGTFLHTRKFYNHNPANQNDDHSFLFYKKNKLIALISFVLLNENGNLILHSHLRATYGGFVFSNSVGVKEAINITSTLIEIAKDKGVNEIIIRHPFRIFYKEPTDIMDYSLWYHGFTIKYRELEIAIPLHTIESAQKKYTKGAKSGIQKAYKTLTIDSSFAFNEFWGLLEIALKAKYQTTPTHSYEDFCNLINKIGNDKVKLYVARHKEIIVAGILIFIVNKKAIHAQYIAQDINYQQFRPLNGLIHYITQWAIDNKYQYFNLGMANENNGKSINHGLYSFKESHGGLGVLRETMHLKLQ